MVDILGCSSSMARVLLTFFRWDTEALFGALAERGPEWVYKAASVTSRSDVAPPTTTGRLSCGLCCAPAVRLFSYSLTLRVLARLWLLHWPARPSC